MLGLMFLFIVLGFFFPLLWVFAFFIFIYVMFRGDPNRVVPESTMPKSMAYAILIAIFACGIIGPMLHG
jgi:Na+/H+ antiporter NhaC